MYRVHRYHDDDDSRYDHHCLYDYYCRYHDDRCRHAWILQLGTARHGRKFYL